MQSARRRIGIFGWGVVAPKSRNVEAFTTNLLDGGSWLEPFDGFGPSNFLVGHPEFDFLDYKEWIDARFEPRKYSQLDAKMGMPVKYAIGAFVQALEQNPGMEEALREAGPRAHIYVGTGLGDLPTAYETSVDYYRAQRRWNLFWCQPDVNPFLADYRALEDTAREAKRAELSAPPDPADLAPEDPSHEETAEQWYAFWAARSPALAEYLARLREIEGEGVSTDVEAGKKGVLRRKLAARKRLNQEYGCPLEPWSAVDARLLWNIDNIAAAQISMLGRLTGPVLSPVAACSTFGAAIKLADEAIQLGEADLVVVGATDPPPHALSVAAFSGARVLSQDGEVSKPFTGLRGTHVAGGSCIWIVGDADLMRSKGMKPLGLEILGVALSSDADHIITPSTDGQLQVMRSALACAGVSPDEVGTWDMHATATPGDYLELENALSVIPETAQFTGRKGVFGHGMSACGGWELMAQYLGVERGRQFPIELETQEIHPSIQPHADSLVQGGDTAIESPVAGKISMGIGGVNACVISRRWPSE